MAIIGAALIVLLAVTLLVTAARPDLPVLRSSYWWRLRSRRAPTVVERIPVALIGGFLLLFGIYEIMFLMR